MTNPLVMPPRIVLNHKHLSDIHDVSFTAAANCLGYDTEQLYRTLVMSH